MGLYIDPLTDPGPFLAALTERGPILMLGQWSPIPAEAAVVIPRPYAVFFRLGAVAFVCLLATVFAPLLKRDRMARFLAAGMVFATIPVCADVTDGPAPDVSPGSAQFGLLAQFFAFVFGNGRDAAPMGPWRNAMLPVAVFLVIVHVVYAPIALPFRAASPLGPGWVNDRLYVHTKLGPAITHKTLVIVNAPSPVHAALRRLPAVLLWRPGSRSHTSSRSSGSVGDHSPCR